MSLVNLYVDVDSPARILKLLKRAVRKRDLEWPQRLEDEYGSLLTDRDKQREAVRKLDFASIAGWSAVVRHIEEKIREIGEDFESFKFKKKEANWLEYHLASFYRGWIDSGDLDRSSTSTADSD